MICAWIGEAFIYAGIGIRTLSRWPQLCWFSARSLWLRDALLTAGHTAAQHGPRLPSTLPREEDLFR